MKLHDAMQKIIRQFGTPVLAESRLMSLLADYKAFDDFPAMKDVMKEILSANPSSLRSTSKRILPATRLRALSSPWASSQMSLSPQITVMIPMRSRRQRLIRAPRQRRAHPQGAAALRAVSQGHPLAGLPPPLPLLQAASSGSSGAKSSTACGGLTIPYLQYHSQES